MSDSENVISVVPVDAAVLFILCQAIEVASTKGAFTPDQFAALGGAYTTAIKLLQGLKDKLEKQEG